MLAVTAIALSVLYIYIYKSLSTQSPVSSDSQQLMDAIEEQQEQLFSLPHPIQDPFRIPSNCAFN